MKRKKKRPVRVYPTAISIPSSIKPSLATVSVSAGTKFALTLFQVESGTQVEIQIQRVAVLNRQFAMGTGAVINQDRSATVLIDTSSMQPGYYELVAARAVSASDVLVEPTVHQVWKPHSPNERVIFEVTQSSRAATSADLLKEVSAVEAQLEVDFLKPVEAVVGLAQPAHRYFTAFIFVRGMLIGTHMRFPHFEIVPTQSGIDTNDALRLVNKFLKERTKTGVQFEYSKDRHLRSMQANPVCVFHFPAVLANAPEEVRAYAVRITDEVLLALALTRDASGRIFDCVVFEHNGQAWSFAESESYVGNLLSDWLSGETPEIIEKYATQVGRDASDRLLVRLYKEARCEPSVEFQYVRFWAVLEALADLREYDPKDPLLDFQSNKIRANDGRLLTLNSGVNSVFNLFRENELGTTETNWKFINIWFAFRTAVAHHGGLANFTQLSRPAVRTFAQDALNEMRTSNGHDQFLWNLKEDAKILLMRRLNRARPWTDGSSES